MKRHIIFLITILIGCAAYIIPSLPSSIPINQTQEIPVPSLSLLIPITEKQEIIEDLYKKINSQPIDNRDASNYMALTYLITRTNDLIFLIKKDFQYKEKIEIYRERKQKTFSCYEEYSRAMHNHKTYSIALYNNNWCLPYVTSNLDTAIVNAKLANPINVDIALALQHALENAQNFKNLFTKKT